MAFVLETNVINLHSNMSDPANYFAILSHI